MRISTLRFFTAALLVPLAACADTATAPIAETSVDAPDAQAARAPAPGENTIAEIVQEGEDFTILESVLTPELAAALSGKGQYTVFAPTDDAFGRLDAFLNDAFGIGIADLSAGQVETVLLYHTTDGRRAANSVVPKRNERRIGTLLGESFFVRTDGTIRDGLTPAGVRDDAQIGPANISARNGIVHVIDEVLVPPSIVAALLALTGS